jgi:hypothetical protein
MKIHTKTAEYNNSFSGFLICWFSFWNNWCYFHPSSILSYWQVYSETKNSKFSFLFDKENKILSKLLIYYQVYDIKFIFSLWADWHCKIEPLCGSFWIYIILKYQIVLLFFFLHYKFWYFNCNKQVRRLKIRRKFNLRLLA